MMDELSETGMRILRLLKDNLMSIDEVSQRIGRSYKATKGLLEGLRFQGYVTATKIGRSIVYSVPKSVKLPDEEEVR
jgi:predicted transcriptional regulator